jgi:B-cell receptor-associated protein 31
LYLDAIREIFRYQDHADSASPPNMVPPSYSNPEAVREFRAQRNLYICGMALFLWFVIKRLVVLIVETADLVEICESRVQEIDEIRMELAELMKSRLSLQKKAEAEMEDSEKNLEYDLDKKELRHRSRSRGKKEL